MGDGKKVPFYTVAPHQPNRGERGLGDVGTKVDWSSNWSSNWSGVQWGGVVS